MARAGRSRLIGLALLLALCGLFIALRWATRCVFPRLAWRPDELGYEPDKRFPMIECVLTNYRPVMQFGDVMMYEPQP